jgi:hypothetical protein
MWGTNGFGKNNYASNFSEPGRNWGTIGRADGHRALCVRRSQKSGAGATGNKTLEILEKAADAGNVRAMEMLGYVYFTGKEGVPKDGSAQESDRPRVFIGFHRVRGLALRPA